MKFGFRFSNVGKLYHKLYIVIDRDLFQNHNLRDHSEF